MKSWAIRLSILGALLASIAYAAAGDITWPNKNSGGDTIWTVNDAGTTREVMRHIGTGGRVSFARGLAIYSYSSTNPEVGGSTPFQLTSAHNHIQVINPAGAITVRLPATATVGEVWEIQNISASDVTITASGGNTLDVIKRGRLKAVALTATPTSDTNWWIMDLLDSSENTTTSVTPNTGTVSATCAYSATRTGMGPAGTAGARMINLWMKCSGTVTGGSPTELSFTGGIPTRFGQSNSAFRTSTFGNVVAANQVSYLKVEESGTITLANMNVSTAAQATLPGSFDLRSQIGFSRQ